MNRTAADFRRWEIPGIATFPDTPGGLIRVALTPALCSAQVFLQGAHVAAFQPAGAQPVLFMSPRSHFEIGKPIRGGVPVVFDATHSVQQPASLGDSTGGDRTLVEPLARAAAAVGIDGLFLETHPNPDQSPSDGQNMVPLDKLRGVLERVLLIHEARLAGAEAE